MQYRSRETGSFVSDDKGNFVHVSNPEEYKVITTNVCDWCGQLTMEGLIVDTKNRYYHFNCIDVARLASEKKNSNQHEHNNLI